MTHSARAALAGVIVAVTAGGAIAQERGTVATFSIASDIELNDNVDLSQDDRGGVILNNVFRYDLDSRTAVDTFSFNAGGNARVIDPEDDDIEGDTDDIDTGLSFSRSVDDTRLGFDARYRRDRLDLFDPLVDLDDDGTFDDTTSGGTRESLRTSVNLNLNEDGPVGFLGRGSYSRVRFNDQDDETDNDDRDRADARGEFVFRVSPLISLTTGLRYGEDLYTRDDTDRRSLRGDVGANLRINQRTSSQVRLGYSEVDTVRDGVEERETGVVGSVVFTVAERVGELQFGADVDLDENGQRYGVFVGRSLETETTLLDADIGLTTSEETDVNLRGGISYSLVARRTEIDLALRQDATVDEDGDNVVNTSARAGITQALTRVTSVSLSVSGGLRRNLDDDDDETERASVTAQISRAITPDWAWSAGYRGRYERSDNEDGRTSNAVFVGLRRDFSGTR